MITMSASINSNQILLVALKHLEQSILAGQSIVHLNEVGDVAAITSEQINCLSASFSNRETYLALALSSCHLSDEDEADLTRLAKQGGSVMARDVGFFLKLPQSEFIDEFIEADGLSESLSNIVRWASNHDFALIEFDCDADVFEQFPVYEKQ